MQNIRSLAVIGGNAAGIAAALRARRRCPDLDISIVELTDQLAIANCSIPAYLAGRIEDVNRLQQLTPEEVSVQHRINVLLSHQVLEIKPIKHQIIVENMSTGQQFELPYQRLVIATGASPIRPNWSNRNTQGIFTLRNLADAKNLKQYIERERPENFVIIGTGTIAQVCASRLRSLGLKVTLIGRYSGLMEDLEEPISQQIINTLKNHDIELYFTDNKPSIKLSLEGKVEAIEYPGRKIVCQGILLAVGVQPNSSFCNSADIRTDEMGAIGIDRHLMTSRQGIYACGDCALTYHRITHKPFYWPLATTAVHQGREAGESASGGQGFDPGTLGTRFWSCFDLQIGRVGLSSRQADTWGIKYKKTIIQALSKPKLYGGSELDLVILSDPQRSGRILGAQLAGCEGVLARINTLATAIDGKLTLRDLERLDLAYTPEHSSLWDPVQIAGRVGSKPT